MESDRVRNLLDILQDCQNLYITLNHDEKLKLIRQDAREISKNKRKYQLEILIYITSEMRSKLKTTFGLSYLMDLSYYLYDKYPGRKKRTEIEEYIGNYAYNYSSHYKKEQHKIIHRLAHELRKNSKYENTYEYRMLIQRRQPKRKFGISLYSDLAYYMYN